jgi:DNA topoisomerase-1
LIVEREEEIEKFKTQEYWRLQALSEKENIGFEARLTHYLNQKLEQFTVKNTDEAHDMRDALLKTANGSLLVEKIDKKQRKRRPAPPFITSTLQQEAARKLGFTARKTMTVAQQLYEGIDIGSGTVGLITYMRTDSVHLATEALDQIRAYIQSRYGDKNCPKDIRVYKTKSKNAQEAHEAIRPTDINNAPEALQSALTPDQIKLYGLIWKRTLASQMMDALLDTVAVDFSCGEGNRFRANGSVIVFPGFLSVYEEGLDDAKKDDGKDKTLPAFEVGEQVKLLDIRADQHFTEPPPRYSEASLVKALEEFDIGRPSTYASIIHTLQQREYVTVEKKRFTPTDVGRIVGNFLTKYFTRYVDYQFTSALEDTLDAVARGEKEWIPVLEEFWKPFIKEVHQIDEQVQRKDVTTEEIDEKCPKCQKALAIRLGKRGRFIGCSGYPDCDYTKDVEGGSDKPAEPEIVEGRQCPQCEKALQIKTSRFGRFIGCTGYPSCKFIEPLEKPADTGVSCAKCLKGKLLKRKSRRGKIFYSCGEYPKCDYAIWNEPVDKICPKCAWPHLTMKETKRSGKQLVCPKEGCDFIENVE